MIGDVPEVGELLIRPLSGRVRRSTVVGTDQSEPPPTTRLSIHAVPLKLEHTKWYCICLKT